MDVIQTRQERALSAGLGCFGLGFVLWVVANWSAAPATLDDTSLRVPVVAYHLR